MEEKRNYFRVILNIVIPLTGIVLVCFLGPKVLRFFMPFVIGWVIAMIANPLVRFLERKLKIVRKHSSALIVILVLALILGLLYLVLSKLIMQAVGFAKDLPTLFDAITAELQEVMRKFDRFFELLPPSVQTSLDKFTNNIEEYLNLLIQKIATPTVEAAGSVAKGIPNAMVNAVITIFSSYLFIAERDKMMTVVRKYLPEFTSRYMGYLKKDVKHLIGGYFLAQFRIMFVVGLVLAVGFLVLQIKYGFLLAILIALLDFLPVFGTGTALIPWAVVRLLTGDYFFALGLALIYVLTQVIRQLIQPKIVGDTMGLSPIMTLFLLYLGFKIQGIAGMIFAVPIGLLVINLYKYGFFDTLIENTKILIHDVNEFRKKD